MPPVDVLTVSMTPKTPRSAPIAQSHPLALLNADYDERDQVRITALLRCLYSVQNWLRMREEFWMPGTESGPVLVWALDTLLKEIRAGNFPHNAPNNEPDR
jgi:hypothetical protein